eukprot:TRINITY_DN18514_c0_g1_i1.p1 TRINITY_DN18514_c0_g1~~TRINITY_DN18514_c0_g1_i1.p1  ORF type:complete len:149 (-),score=41.91 TRINITY_DN18514_c0_g1_i1:23-469(-)
MSAVVKSKFTQDQVDEYTQVFNNFDRNKDGTIDASELSVVMRDLGLTSTKRDVEQMIASVDKDKNGTIDLEEFMILMQGMINRPVDYREIFKAFDVNGDGYVTAKELKAVMNSIGELISDADVQMMIDQADGDSDGRVSYTEFVNFLG